MSEHAVYNADDGKWYRAEDGFSIFVSGVIAATYPEAFELLYGHPVPIPPPVRAPRRESIFTGD
jgi:hypothetical protein